MNNTYEYRSIETIIADVDENSRHIHGLAIPVNSRSTMIRSNDGDFYEIIAPEAITEDFINTQDIKLYLNHDFSQGTFARSKYGNGSLKLTITERGLEYDCDIPNTVFGDMLLEGIKRGDYDALSFAFLVRQDKWQSNGDGTYQRTIYAFKMIDEISILSERPAYEQTNVSLRSLQDYKEELRNAEEEQKQKEAEIMNRLNEKLTYFNDLDKYTV